MSSDIAIRVENLGKKYKLGLTHKGSLRNFAGKLFGRKRVASDQLTVDSQNPSSALATSNSQLATSSATSNASPQSSGSGLSTLDSRPSSEFWALKDVSFEVKRGEVLGVIGRNGAGKSTLLKILSQITKPTTGGAEIYGRVGSLLEVGTGFHPELTGRENVYLNGAILGMTKREIDRKFDEIVDFAGVEKFIDTPVKRYSSGMHVRLGFAVAAHLEPEILIVDEVLAVGDAEFQRRCLGKMKDVAHDGRTVLFVSHNMSAILQLCTECILIRNGFAESHGPPRSVVAEYINLAGASCTSARFCSPAKQPAFIANASLTNGRSDNNGTFSSADDLVITTTVHLRRSFTGIQLGLAIFNELGERLCYHSNEYGHDPVRLTSPGDYSLRAQLPLRFLLPGSYSLNLALHQPNVELIELREHALRFNVQPSIDASRDYHGSAHGKVWVDVDWTVVHNAPSV